jgi:acylphosphatase
MQTLHIKVKGKVQGVFYRATAREVAGEIGLQGWVRNTEDGDVEIMATGSDEQLQAFLGWCRKGPSGARVDDVVFSQKDETTFEGFSIIR